MTTDPVQRFLEPLSDANPAGEELSFDPVLDEIKEARRADDPTLAQGEWVRELKTADWNLVLERCEGLLLTRTKDLQVAGWYVEALAHKQGFPGLATGLRILEGLLADFWECLHPGPAQEALDLRIGRLEWLDATVGAAVRGLPLLPASAGGLSWAQWQESREVENLGLKSPERKAAAIQAGRLSAEAFDKAVRSAGGAWFKQIHQDVGSALQACNAILARLDRNLGGDAPSLESLKAALEGCEALVRSLRARFEAVPPADPRNPAPGADADPVPVPHAAPVPATAPGRAPMGRAQAIVQLRQVAEYFRSQEPHSPVAPLVERAARWAEMNLESWLTEVVPDQGVLTTLKTLLDFREE